MASFLLRVNTYMHCMSNAVRNNEFHGHFMLLIPDDVCFSLTQNVLL